MFNFKLYFKIKFDIISQNLKFRFYLLKGLNLSNEKRLAFNKK